MRQKQAIYWSNFVTGRRRERQLLFVATISSCLLIFLTVYITFLIGFLHI